MQFGGTGTTGNVVAGNLIGLNAFGSPVVGGNGITFILGASANTIGGTTAAAANTISGNGGDGIALFGSSDNNVIEGNYIGTDANSSVGLGNIGNGILLNNGPEGTTIGGTNASARNIISGNLLNGVTIAFTGNDGNVVEGNYIGTNVGGTAALANSAFGIEILSAGNNAIGGTATAAGNVISGNISDGLDITGSATTGNLVQGNFVGTNAAGTAAVGNGGSGITIDNSSGNVIGGVNRTAAQSQIISSGGNLQEAQGAAIGPDGDLYVADPAAQEVVKIDPTSGTETIVSAGQFFANPLAIAFAANGDLYVLDNQAHTTSFGAVIQVNATTGIQTILSQDQFFANPRGIAVAPDGTIYVADQTAQAVIAVDPNTGHQTAVSSGGSLHSPIGITTDSNGNLYVLDSDAFPAAGTPGAVFQIDRNTGNQTLVSPSGGSLLFATAITAGPDGSLFVTEPSIRIGHSLFLGGIEKIDPTTQAQTDVYDDDANSLHQLLGIAATADGEVYVTEFGNLTSISDIRQVLFGIHPGNVISGNNSYGVQITDKGGSGNVIQGNYIGVSATGNTAVGNDVAGIRFGIGADSNTIGGTAPGAGNVIGGSRDWGIAVLGGDNNLLQGNIIGFDSAANLGAANQGDGIFVANETGIGGNFNTIGGNTAAAANIIDGNDGSGIEIFGATNNLVQGNYSGLDGPGLGGSGNGADGVLLVGGSSDNTIGGLYGSEGNLIGANANGAGVHILASVDNLVEGNDIGASAGVSNLYGIEIAGDTFFFPGGSIPSYSLFNTIGGTDFTFANVIAGNSADNILIQGFVQDTTVRFNYVGTDFGGNAITHFSPVGVEIVAESGGVTSSNTIQNNVIAGSTQANVFIHGSGEF